MGDGGGGRRGCGEFWLARLSRRSGDARIGDIKLEILGDNISQQSKAKQRRVYTSS